MTATDTRERHVLFVGAGTPSSGQFAGRARRGDLYVDREGGTAYVNSSDSFPTWDVLAGGGDLGPVVSIQTGTPVSGGLTTPIVFDDRPTAGGLYVWDSGLVDYVKVASPPGGFTTNTVIGMNLTAPAVSDDDWFVVDGPMQATPYTLAHATIPGTLPARTLTITCSPNEGDDTVGDMLIEGLDANNNPASETITLVNNAINYSQNAYSTITSITTPDWVANGAVDSIRVGFGNGLGLPRVSPSGIFAAFVDGVAIKPNSFHYGDEVAGTWVDLSNAVYDGVKEVHIEVLAQ